MKMRVGAMDGAPHVSAARVRAARAGAWARHRPDGRRARHLYRGRCQALLPDWSRTATSPGSRSRSSPTTRPAWRRCAPPSRVPIATGESEATRYAFRDLAVLRAADIFQPDLGLLRRHQRGDAHRRARRAFNLRLAPHLWAGAPAFFAGLHVCGRLAGELRRRVFARRQPDAARADRGEGGGQGRHDRDPGPARTGHHGGGATICGLTPMTDR